MQAFASRHPWRCALALALLAGSDLGEQIRGQAGPRRLNQPVLKRTRLAVTIVVILGGVVRRRLRWWVLRLVLRLVLWLGRFCVFSVFGVRILAIRGGRQALRAPGQRQPRCRLKIGLIKHVPAVQSGMRAGNRKGLQRRT